MRIRGALTPPPSIEEPVRKMPLGRISMDGGAGGGPELYHAAPMTLRPIQSAIPMVAHVYGDVSSRNLPIYPAVSTTIQQHSSAVESPTHIECLALILEKHVYRDPKSVRVSPISSPRKPTRANDAHHRSGNRVGGIAPIVSHLAGTRTCRGC